MVVNCACPKYRATRPPLCAAKALCRPNLSFQSVYHVLCENKFTATKMPYGILVNLVNVLELMSSVESAVTEHGVSFINLKSALYDLASDDRSENCIFQSKQ